MKNVLILLLAPIILLSACRSSKDYLERKDEDKALAEAIKKLGKSPNDEKALAAVPVLYSAIKTKHLENITSLNKSLAIGRWDKIINEYNYLQQAYEAIVNNTAAYKAITPESYAAPLMDAKDKAAAEYYNEAEKLLETGIKSDSKLAYSYYKKADKYVPGYKDVAAKKQLALDNAVVNVVVNPIWDNSFFYSSGFGNYGLNYSNEYFQQTLVRELNYENNNNLYAARFYNDWELRRSNISPDWIIDLRLSNMNIPYPQTQGYQRSVSNTIEMGKDSSGRPISKTVYATMYITRHYFNANGTMEVVIKDMENRGRIISNRSFSESVRWERESATYSGDERALSSSDWTLINNSRYSNEYRREDVLTELYRKIYPRVKNEISYAVRW